MFTQIFNLQSNTINLLTEYIFAVTFCCLNSIILFNIEFAVVILTNV